MIDRQTMTVGVVAFCLGAICAFVLMTLRQRTHPMPIVIVPPEPTPTAEPSATPSPYLIDVAGAVAQPGVYQLPPDSRVADALTAAGGLSAEANADLVNLAQPLQDGKQVMVPALGEPATTAETVTFADSSRSPAVEVDLGDGAGELVNLNSAEVEQLDSLPGIGPATAEKIIAYREQNGPFTSVEQLLDVSGIGEATFAELEPLVTVGN